MSPSHTLLLRLAESAEGLLRGGYLLVQDGEGFESLPEHLPLRGGKTARVVRAASELHLRHAVWKAGETPLIALVPENLELPADLRQGAERRRVHTLTGDELLTALLGTRVAGVDDADLRSLAIEHAETIRSRLHAQTTPTVIDRALLERTLVEVVAELDDLRSAEGRVAALLAAWVQRPPRWPAPVMKLAAHTLRQHHGPLGAILAWALDDPGTRLRALVVHGAVLTVAEAPEAAWGPLAPVKAPGGPLMFPDQARDWLGKLATETARELGHAAAGMLDEADSLANRLLSTASLRTSKLLPLAFTNRAHDIATGLATGRPADPAELRALREHAVAGAERDRLDLLERLARLVRWLNTPVVERGAVELAGDYLTDHAHADRCVREVQRALASARHHQAEARAVLERVFAKRDALNRAWADGLAAQYERVLFDRRVVALQNLVRDELIGPAPASSAAKTYLVVLDGCSVPVFLDLLDQLTEAKVGVGLGTDTGLRQRLKLGLAPLPTITSHARGALFLGAVPKDAFAAETLWREQGERTADPARFKQNVALGNRTRRLFLKGDLTDGGAALLDALRSDIELVATVFNAVDDRIGSHDVGAAWRMEAADIAGFIPSLLQALDSGRRVVLTADHGHTPYRGNALRVGAGETPRYMPVNAAEAVPEGFLEIDCGGLTGTRERLAFAWRSGVYRGAVQVGFHGGCSLEEMVVPVAWLVRHGQPADRPAWWLEAAGLSPSAQEAPRPVEAPRPAPAPVSVASAPVAPALPLQAAAAPVQRVPFVIRQDLAHDERAIDALAWLIAEGPIRGRLLAAKLGRPESRLAGWFSRVNDKLAVHEAALHHQELPDGELLWRYDGPSETA